MSICCNKKTLQPKQSNFANQDFAADTILNVPSNTDVTIDVPQTDGLDLGSMKRW